VEGSFVDGVSFLLLAPTRDLILIIQTIAQSLSLSESPIRLSLDGLQEFLRNKLVLVMLEIFKQTVTAALYTYLLQAWSFGDIRSRLAIGGNEQAWLLCV